MNEPIQHLSRQQQFIFDRIKRCEGLIRWIANDNDLSPQQKNVAIEDNLHIIDSYKQSIKELDDAISILKNHEESR